MRRLLYIVVLVALVVLGVLFGSINQQLADLNLLIISVQLRVVDIAVLFLLLGVVLGFIVAMLFRLQRRAKRWQRKSVENG